MVGVAKTRNGGIVAAHPNAMEPGEGYTCQDVQDALSISRSSGNAAFRLFSDKLGYTKMNYIPGPLGRMVPTHWLTPAGLSAKEYFRDLCND